MLNKEDPNKIRRFSREDLKNLIPNFGDQVKPPRDYIERVSQEKQKREKTLQEEAKDFLLRAIEYFNSYSPERPTTLNIGNLGLFEELDKLSEKQLFEVQKILDFAHDPFEGKRFIQSIPEHNRMDYIISQCKTRIPGFEDRVRLMKLKQEKTEMEKQETILIERINKAQIIFKEKKPILNIEKPDEVISDKLKWCCPVCKEIIEAPNRGGIGSHVKFKHTEEEFGIYKAMTNEELIVK